MELLKKNIHMMYEKNRVTDQLTLEEDCIVPDSLPDADRIIQKKAFVKTDEIQVDEGRVTVSGELKISILYLADTPQHQPARLDTQIPFVETQSLEGAKSKENTQVTWDTEDLSVTLINSRKLSLRALLTFRFRVEEESQVQAVVEVHGMQELSCRRKELELLQMKHQKKDIFRIKEELALPSSKPNIVRILWESVQLRGTDIRTEEGKLEIKGELFVFVLYEGEEENGGKQWLESAVPFQGSLDYAECMPDLVSQIESRMSQSSIEIQEDYDGEKRLLSLEAVLDLDIRLYEEEQADILEDLYSPVKDLVPVRERQFYENLLAKTSTRIRAGERIHLSASQPRMLQTCNGDGEVKIDEAQITDQGILIEGAVFVNVLYVSSDDKVPYSVMEGAAPFQYLAEIPEITKESRFTIQTNLEQLAISMVDSETIEVKAGVALQVLAVGVHSEEFITGVEEKALDLQKLQELPGLIGYIVQPGDTLWSISKSCYTTPERICSLNQIEEKDVRPGLGLVILKTVS